MSLLVKAVEAGSDWFQYRRPGGNTALVAGVVTGAISDTASWAVYADMIWAIPFMLGKGHQAAGLRLQVTTAASGGKIRLGIYDDGGGIYPGALIKDAGEIDAGSTGIKTLTFSAVDLAGGLKWAAVAANSNIIQIRCTQDAPCAVPLGMPWNSWPAPTSDTTC